ncbi:MAG: Gx transporter family protein [Magnetococcales bacterium]|nr:Gx transporter family protein [Magnetococcales bacterium]NGZ04865.1 Gx transporter family protein [Magnetococcales bacterium]
MNGHLTLSPLRQDLLIAYLTAAAVVAHLLEAALPGAGPWFKPGVANVFALVAFLRLGWKAAAAVTLLRILTSSMALGMLFTPGFWLSLAGGCGAMGALALLRLLPNRLLGPVGISLLAALAHMAGQIVMAWVWIIGHAGILSLLPWFLAGSWFSGIVNGVLTFLVLEQLDRHRDLLTAP